MRRTGVHIKSLKRYVIILYGENPIVFARVRRIRSQRKLGPSVSRMTRRFRSHALKKSKSVISTYVRNFQFDARFNLASRDFLF